VAAGALDHRREARGLGRPRKPSGGGRQALGCDRFPIVASEPVVLESLGRRIEVEDGERDRVVRKEQVLAEGVLAEEVLFDGSPGERIPYGPVAGAALSRIEPLARVDVAAASEQPVEAIHQRARQGVRALRRLSRIEVEKVLAARSVGAGLAERRRALRLAEWSERSSGFEITGLEQKRPPGFGSRERPRVARFAKELRDALVVSLVGGSLREPVESVESRALLARSGDLVEGARGFEVAFHPASRSSSALAQSASSGSPDI